MKTVKLKCTQCSKEFQKGTHHYKADLKKGKKDFFCGLFCAGRYRQTKVEAQCNFCGAKVVKVKSQLRDNNFCSSSCAAKFNNANRDASVYKKQSETLKRKIKNGELSKPQPTPKNYCSIRIKTCNGCKKPFLTAYYLGNSNRVTCSDECAMQASVGCRKYPNGKRKLTWFYNKYQKKEVLLESSWEVRLAKFLDGLNIVWVRPPSIYWFDSSNKKRYYFPDFYLPDYDIYLDPKNKYLQGKDQYKLDDVRFRHSIHLISGFVDFIQESLEKIMSDNR